MYFSEDSRPLTPPQSDEESDLKASSSLSSSSLQQQGPPLMSNYNGQQKPDWQSTTDFGGHYSSLHPGHHDVIPQGQGNAHLNHWTPQQSGSAQAWTPYHSEDSVHSGHGTSLASALDFHPVRRTSVAPEVRPSAASDQISLQEAGPNDSIAGSEIAGGANMARKGQTHPVVTITPMTNSATASAPNFHRNNQREQTTDRAVKRIETAVNTSMIGEGLRNNVSATLQILSLGLSDKSEEPKAGEIAAHRLRIIERLSSAGEVYLTAFLQDQMGRKVLFEWLKEAMPGKEGEVLKEERQKMIQQTLSPMILLYKALPMKVEYLQSESKFGKLVKILSKRNLSKAIAPDNLPNPTQLVAGMLSDWQALLPEDITPTAAEEPAKSSAPAHKPIAAAKRKPSPEESATSLTKKPKTDHQAISKASGNFATSQPASTKAPSSSKAATPKASVMSGNVKTATAVKVKADSSFFGTGGSVSSAAINKKKAPAAKTADAPSSTTRAAAKRKPDALDDLLFAPAAKKSPQAEVSPAPADSTPTGKSAASFSTADSKQIKAKKSVRWKPDSQLEQIRFIESTQDVDASLHADVAQHGLGILEHDEGRSLKNPRVVMDEEIDWYTPQDVQIPPPPMDRVPNPERGRDSEEKKKQEARESSILFVSYDSMEDIPPTPAEPDVVHEDTTEPKVIPMPEIVVLSDTNSAGSVPAALPMTSLEQMGLNPAFLQSLLSQQTGGQSFQPPPPPQMPQYGSQGGPQAPAAWSAPSSAGSMAWNRPASQSGYPAYGGSGFIPPAPLGMPAFNATPSYYPPNAKTKKCTYFALGRCKKGDQCTFLH